MPHQQLVLVWLVCGLVLGVWQVQGCLVVFRQQQQQQVCHLVYSQVCQVFSQVCRVSGSSSSSR
jgi:hypothetical protein